ncbi:beclin-1-like protein [Agrilus planipennis]|uniref:Beclin-1-like protein n=1 Tax=Agrilus planipennis TaxID=224129 RepID=A0A1W4XDM2_AGRPL|nr:beclin-1-like protein [Agrilus planipennis]
MMRMAEEKVLVSFACQRCLQPLRLDDSFNNLSEHTLAELHLPVQNNVEIDLDSQTTSLDHFVQPCRLSDSGNGANGFMLVTDTGEVELISNQLKVKAALFDTLSGYSNIDHPLCEECTDTLIDLLEKQVELTQKDYEDYYEYLKKLEEDTQQPQLDSLENELKELEEEEKRLIIELENLQLEEEKIITAINEQETEAERLKHEEDRLWREYTRHRQDYLLTEDEYRSLECQLSYAQSQLDKLKKTNVFNATFHIWHAGHFGTINNFRLGRLPSAPVDWSEINAAWGQTALLLAALARKIGLTFERYKLVPFGNHSYIEVIAEQKELPLYGSGGFRFLWDTKFDSGMVAFLDCLQQFKEKVEEGDKDFRLPYRMNKGKIEDSSSEVNYSVKIQFNSEEQWTKALKFMLTNLKWSLAWVSSQFNSDDD